ncbi:MAG: DUF1810 domain-containing protein [Methylomicrobium sp.]|nr:DUF1810 domain-containing protein [Methylomicrobium sp.]
MQMDDNYCLIRFVEAQASVYEHVCSELRRGHKTSHWMWFIFPQIKGLGHSAVAKDFAISSRKEAEAYLQHPLLGPRLHECTRLVNALEGLSISQIFGYPDDLKFLSCMTLFVHATTDNQDFATAIQKYFAGHEDPLTIERLEG